MDFNVLHKSEKGFNDTPILMNEIDLFFSEVEILLTTDTTDVMGKNDFGFNATDLIWKLGSNESVIKGDLRNRIEEFCISNEFLKFWDVEIKFFQGNDKDVAFIDIIAVPYDGESSKKSYIFN